jgi:LPXTG-motif cell wall-anchored protein
MKLLLAAALSVPLLASPATAATFCTVVPHSSNAGILTTTDGEAPVAALTNASAGTAVLRPDGVELSLPDAQSKTQFLVNLSPSVPLAGVTDLRYRLEQLVPGSTVLPSYQLVINPEPDVPAGVHFTTLVYEPYQNGYAALPANTFHTFDVDEAPQSWWSTKTLSAIPGAIQGAQKPFTLKTYTDVYPGATVTAYGFNFGKGSANQKARAQSLTFATKNGCVVHQWSKPTTSPSPSASASPSPSVSSTATASPSVSTSTASSTPSTSTTTASPSSSVTIVPSLAGDDAGNGDLPVTGVRSGAIVLAALAFVGLGGAAIVLARRRRSRH